MNKITPDRPYACRELFLCVYDEPSTDLCLHKNLYLANVHHRAFKRDGVQSKAIE